ncbi:hypothetical protein [Bowmanella dokdonensis]|uniref:Uncharacterized protein n=1 Tax=Bowmanella dokdonensis TaxID=751969 RepID=A0A939DKK2_9ALTE|nr:hypothetical protein [Bowmanella dokdonensis]MBN7824270.1 hypothetical protein [Bowmanella dokdonensis]
MRKEEQLDWLGMELPKKRGGARKGAGRKAWRGKTQVKRVPERYAEAIDELIAHLDQIRGKNRHKSELLARDLDDRLVRLTLTSKHHKQTD